MIPVPAFLIKWAGERLAKAIVWALTILLAIGLLVGIYFGVKSYFTADLTARVKVISGQLQAGGESAHDAVQTQGNVMENEQATDAITRENADVITKAAGADAPVAPAARNAGLLALCRRASFRAAHPACVQQPPAR